MAASVDFFLKLSACRLKIAPIGRAARTMPASPPNRWKTGLGADLAPPDSPAASENFAAPDSPAASDCGGYFAFFSNATILP